MKLRMTDQALTRLRPGADRIEVWDDLVSGLLLTVHPSGRKSWSVRYRADGKRHKLHLGTFPDVALRDAREHARSALIAVTGGDNPAHDRQREIASKEARRRSEAQTIAEMLDVYDQLHLSTLRTRKQALSFLKGFREEFGRTPLDQFTATDFTRLLDKIVMAGHATSANRVYSHVQHFFGWCVGRALLESNPCERVRKPAKEQIRDRFLTDAEIRVLWQATGEDLEPFGHLARFLLLTGQRLNEAARMTASEVDGAHWSLAASRVKNNSRHDVWLPTQALAIVNRPNRVVSESGYIFTTNGVAPVSGFSKALSRLRARMDATAGRAIEHFTFHDLRRTCETGLAMQGTPQPIIDRITNHLTGRGMARIYNQHSYSAERQAALQRWADHVSEIAG